MWQADAVQQQVWHPASLLNQPSCSQVIFALPSDEHQDIDYVMRIFNSDGSEPEMCGNGIRCLARFVADQDGSGSKQHRVHTGAGQCDPCSSADGRPAVCGYLTF